MRRLLAYEWGKLFHLPALWVFLGLCLAFNGLLLGSVAGVIVAILTNVFLIFPAYMALYGMDWAAIVQMCTAVNPWITNVPTMVAFSIVPFNVISFGVTSILAMLLYKKISVPLKKFAMIG